MIKRLKQSASQNGLGLTMQTAQMRGSLSALAMKCANALSAFAASTKNNSLLQKIGYTDSLLSRLKNDELQDVCQFIHDEAAAHLAEAGAFGYTTNDVTALHECLHHYHDFQNHKQEINRKNQVKDLMSEFRHRNNRAA